MYAVQARVTTRKVEWDGQEWESAVSLPTFYLDPNVQGFTDEAGAERVAREILAFVRNPGDTVHITVVDVGATAALLGRQIGS